MISATTLVIPPFLAYDQAMRYLAALTLMILVVAQPIAAQGDVLAQCPENSY